MNQEFKKKTVSAHEINLIDVDLSPFCSENNEIVAWTLQRQAELRLELMNFYKKDFIEIQSAIAAIEPDITKQDSMMCDIVENYKQLWEETFSIFDME